VTAEKLKKQFGEIRMQKKDRGAQMKDTQSSVAPRKHIARHPQPIINIKGFTPAGFGVWYRDQKGGVQRRARDRKASMTSQKKGEDGFKV